MRHKTRLSPLPAAVMLALSPLPAPAQDDARPAGWMVLFDEPAAPDSSLFFVTMEPGWHVTSGPAALLVDPAHTAAGEYRLEAEIFLFPGESDAGFGLMFGGKELESERAGSYFQFLLRRDGSFMIAHRAGTDLHVLDSWTTHDAVIPAEGSEEPVLNTLAVEAGAGDIRFLVNGDEVGRYPRSPGMGLDGAVGLRVGNDLNLHVRSLSIEMSSSGG